MNKKLLMSGVMLVCFCFGYSQTKEELETAKKAKKDSISAIQKRVDAIDKAIESLPGWRVGAFGVVGGSFSNFNNWYAQGTPNNTSGSIGITFNGFANLVEEKFFWRNSLNTNLNWIKLDDKDDPNDDDSFSPTTDVFNFSSLYGRKLSKNFAISTLLEYRTTLLNNFNDPGYLDVGVGGTWTPIDNLDDVIHPLNYNFVFAENETIFESSLGAKIVADYTRQIGGVNFKSNLSVFQSYKSGDLSNWTWTNGFAYTVWKNFGVGFDLGLRSNKQEALNYALDQYALLDPPTGTEPNFDNVDNDLQTYYTLGLSYKF